MNNNIRFSAEIRGPGGPRFKIDNCVILPSWGGAHGSSGHHHLMASARQIVFLIDKYVVCYICFFALISMFCVMPALHWFFVIEKLPVLYWFFVIEKLPVLYWFFCHRKAS